MRENKLSQIVLWAISLLFFLQVLSDFIQSIYAFGLLVTAFTVQLAAILLLFTPLLLLLVRRPPTRPWMIGLAAVALLGRLLEPLLDPGGRLVACGVSVGAFMLLFPVLLAAKRPQESVAAGGEVASEHGSAERGLSSGTLPSALLLAVSTSIFLRVANSSVDLSEAGIYQFIGWVLAIVAARLVWSSEAFGSNRGRGAYALSSRTKRGDSKSSEPPSSQLLPSTGRVIGLCIGLASVIVMLYFGFTSPTVIARWTGYSYAAVISVLMIALTMYAAGMNSLERARCASLLLTSRMILAWNALFVIMLALTILPHQVAFPNNPAGYPFEAPPVGMAAMLPLFLMLLLSPIVFIDVALYARQLSDEGTSIGQLGAGFALAALFILVMVFFHVFTTIYDYAPVVGPLFRDRFWLVYLLTGLGLALPGLLIRRRNFVANRQAPLQKFDWFLPILVGLLAVLSIGAAGRMANPTDSIPATTGQFRVMTYNIQQGFDRVGNANLQRQLDVIRQVAPDILGLQESDTARVANGNVDAVRFFADNLGMYSYYGPTTTTGTFGIALLSKHPIQNPHTFFLYSSGEQTAAIQSEIQVNARTYNIFVTHLGNNGDMVQLQAVLQRVDSLPNVILMGDFNFNPTTVQYARATQGLADAWLLRWPAGKDIPGLGTEGRIDQMFVSRGTQVLDSEYVVNPVSDHPYLYSVLKP